MYLAGDMDRWRGPVNKVLKLRVLLTGGEFVGWLRTCYLLKKDPTPWNQLVSCRGSVRSTRGLGPTMTTRGQSIGILIGMLPQTLIMSITVQKTSKYYTTVFDLQEGF